VATLQRHTGLKTAVNEKMNPKEQTLLLFAHKPGLFLSGFLLTSP